MSEAAAPAAAPAATTETATSAAPGGVPGPSPAATAPSVEQRIADLLKDGGLEVTAGGAKHKIQDVDSLKRYLQRGIPADSVLKQVAEERSKLAPVAQALQALKEGDDATAEQLLQQLMGPERLRAIAMQRVRREFEEEQKMQGMTPRERELAAELRKLRGDKSTLEQTQKQQEQMRAQAEQQQAVQRYQQHIGENVGKALDMMGIPNTMVHAAIRHMRPTLEAMLSNNIPLDPQTLVDTVRPEFEDTLKFLTKNLDGEKLLQFLGADVGKKVRAALLAQAKGGAGVPVAAGGRGPDGRFTNTTVTPTGEGDKPKPKLDFRKPMF